MNEKEMIEHIELLQESLDDAMQIMIKIETKIKALKRALQKHRKTILTTNDYNEDRRKADEKIWEILDYDELFSEES
jgi:folate-dependent phosphoribosylglycinamide formyltransferase PurN